MEIYMAIAAGMGGMLGWGLADFFAKKSTSKIGGFKTLLWMQIFGALPILTLFFFSKESVNLAADVMFLIFLFTVGDLFGYFLFYRGIQKGKVGLLSSIYTSQAGISVLVSVLIFGEQITQLRWAGLAITLIGVILVSFQLRGSDKFSSKNIIHGLPEILASAVIFGFYFPFWDWFLRYRVSGWIAPSTLQRVFAITILLLIVCVIYLNRNRKTAAIETAPQERKIWIWLILIGFFDAIAALSTAWGYKFTDITSVVVVLSAAFSLPTLILARIFLKENLTLNQIIGVIIILGGLVVLAI